MDLPRYQPPLAFFERTRNHRDPLEEESLADVTFTVHKLNNRPKPKKERIKIVSCFSEFGCETIGCLYCIPRLLRRYPGQYIIGMGWYGREYLYRHLFDEFWEIDEKFMWLREYTRAFHHVSKNLQKIEEAATIYGDVVPSSALGMYAVSNMCRTCGKFWYEWMEQAQKCPLCKSTVLVRSAFTDTQKMKHQARMIPKPSQSIMDWAKGFVKPKTVGIFARNRKTYGRNLSPEFYSKLISLVESKGYNVIWLGEKQTTLPCPVDHVVDFSRMPESRDLEKTLAIICQLEFTIQFWTASTRLAGMMGVPFLLFESPEQIYASKGGLASAQEGKRLELVSFGPRKVVLAHYHNVVEQPDTALDLVGKAISEMQAGNWTDILGMAGDDEFVTQIQDEFYKMLT